MTKREKELDRIAKLLIRRDLELTAANERLEELDRVKSNFISVAAHQLRTPLSGIKWVLKMLIDGDAGELSEEQLKLVEDGFATSERMVTLINDFLDAARIDEGRFVYNKKEVEVRDLLESTMNNFLAVIEEKDLSLTYLLPKEGSTKVSADVSRLAIVFDNLIENAINYTPPGGKIVISIKTTRSRVKFCVKDSGLGIPQDQQSRIFTRFFRGSNVLKETQGTGLGLFISRNIVEAHGGEIGFTSENGEGAEFCFSLPKLKE